MSITTGASESIVAAEDARSTDGVAELQGITVRGKTMDKWTKCLFGLEMAVLLLGVVTVSADDVQRVVLKVEGMF